MATKLNAEGVTKGELFLIDPTEISVNEALNGRWQPHEEDAIDELATSINESGQLQPCGIRKTGDGSPQLVFGYRRFLAIQKLNKGRKAENRIKVKCILTDCNDTEALQKNITENKNRKNTSPVDDAINQRRLREEHGWSDTKIAEFYGQSPSMVTLLKKILLLPDENKLRVHRGELALNVAADMVTLSPEEQAEVLKPETPEELAALGGSKGTPAGGEGGEGGKEGGKKKTRKGRKGKGTTPSTTTIKKRLRSLKGAKGGANGTQTGGDGKGGKGGGGGSGSTSRNLREVRTFFENLTGPGEKKIVRDTASWIVKFCNGTYPDNVAENKFREVLA